MNFKAEVLEKSFEKPILVDFWASWCSPCRILGPVIEKLAEEQSERWNLVKVDTEEHQELAEQYQIRSIPNVKLFHKGEVIAEFSGALSRYAIIEWLDEHLPSERKEQLTQILSDLNTEEDIQQLEKYVHENPDIVEAKVALAQIKVYTDPPYALELVKEIKPGDKYADISDRIRTLVELLMFNEGADSPVSTLLQQAKKSLSEQDIEMTIQHLIQATTVDKTHAKELPRRAAIALFQSLGNDHPLTKAYRWKFDMALY
jgi:putative thioredoxin